MYSLAIIKGIEKEKPRKVLVFGGFGAPNRIRTCGLSLRSCGAPVLRRYA